MLTRCCRSVWRSSANMPLGLCLLALLAGCAPFNRDNTPLLNSVEQTLWPASPGLRLAVSPVVVPAGLLAVMADAFVIHPALVVDDAAGDARDALWEGFDWEAKYATECAALPWRAIATPLVFLGDFIGRSTFDIPERHSGDYAGRRERVAREREVKEAIRTQQAESRERMEGDRRRATELLDRAQAALDGGEPAATLAALEQIQECDILDSNLQERYDALRVLAAAQSKQYGALNVKYRTVLSKGPYAPQIAAQIAEMEAGDDALTRRAAYWFELDQAALAGGAEAPILLRMLADANAIIRYQAAQLAGARDKPLRAMLERMAREDPDPIVRDAVKKQLDATR